MSRNPPKVYLRDGVPVMAYSSVARFAGHGPPAWETKIRAALSKNPGLHRLMIGCPWPLPKVRALDTYEIGMREDALLLIFQDREKAGKTAALITAFSSNVTAGPWPERDSSKTQETPESEPIAAGAEPAEPDSSREEEAMPSHEDDHAEPLPNSLIPTRFDVAGCDIKVLTDLDAEAFWWTQAQMAEAFGLAVGTVSYHITENIKSGEISENEATVRYYRIVAPDGKTRSIAHYSLDVFILVGFRARATERTIAFRHKAASIVKDYIAGRRVAPLQQDGATLAFLREMMDRQDRRDQRLEERMDRRDDQMMKVLADLATRRHDGPVTGTPANHHRRPKGEQTIPDFCVDQSFNENTFRHVWLKNHIIKDAATDKWVCTPYGEHSGLVTNRPTIIDGVATGTKYAVLTSKGKKDFEEALQRMKRFKGGPDDLWQN